MMRDKKHDYPLKDTTAARMLTDGLRRAQLEGLSLRKLAQRLDYKQAVVLSHMGTGRVPIPIDRALDIARAVGLPDKEFLMACLTQRHPEINWAFLSDCDDEFSHELTLLAGRPLDELPMEHRWVIREVVADPHPSRRWLKIAELTAVELLRDLRPNLASEGLSGSDRRAVREALSDKKCVE